MTAEGEIILDPRATSNPQVLMDAMQLATSIRKALSSLKPREEMVLRYHFGIDCEPLTLVEIGKRLNVTKERVRQIEKKSIRKLSNPSRARCLWPFTVSRVSVDLAPVYPTKETIPYRIHQHPVLVRPLPAYNRPPKIQLDCSCGWHSTYAGTLKFALTKFSRHIQKEHLGEMPDYKCTVSGKEDSNLQRASQNYLP